MFLFNISPVAFMKKANAHMTRLVENILFYVKVITYNVFLQRISEIVNVCLVKSKWDGKYLKSKTTIYSNMILLKGTLS